MLKFQDKDTAIHFGKMEDVLITFPENCIDTCITDPPYHLQSIVERFGKKGSAPPTGGTEGTRGVYGRSARGFMGMEWDGGDVAFNPETWKQVYRVLKPGGLLFCFGGTRTWHRIAVAIEDAGFEATLIQEETSDKSTQVCRIRINGMTCTSCSSTVEQALQAISSE